MIKTLNYIVGIAVLLVAIGIPLRIYLLNAEERDREQMLEDLGAIPAGNRRDADPSSSSDLDRLEDSKETLRNLGTVGESMDALNDLFPRAEISTSLSIEKRPLGANGILNQSTISDSLFLAALRESSDLPGLLNQPQGVLPDDVTDHPQAMDRYLKRLGQDPDDHKAMYDLAIKYVEAGDIDKADQLADQIKKYDESMAGGLRNLIKTIRRKEK